MVEIVEENNQVYVVKMVPQRQPVSLESLKEEYTKQLDELSEIDDELSDLEIKRADKEHTLKTLYDFLLKRGIIEDPNKVEESEEPAEPAEE